MKLLISIGLLVVLSLVLFRNWLPFPISKLEPTAKLPEIVGVQTIQPPIVRVEEVASNLEVPWSIAFTSIDRMLVTERPGRIRAIVAGQVSHPLITFPNVLERGEEGLMGMVLDPNYPEAPYVYVCLAEHDPLKVRVVKLRDEGDKLTEETTLIDNIPAARFHAGCELLVAPDQTLLITTGDALERTQAQRSESLAGKILRLNLDGSIPADNPESSSPVFSLGHRNPQGLTLGPNNILLSSEHGPSGFDGPGGGDEINLIVPGGNYGWPEVSHTESNPTFIDPLRVYTPAIAPGSILYLGDNLPEPLTNTLLVAKLKGEGLLALKLSPTDGSVTNESVLDIGDLGRIRELALGPDNAIYFSTSNTDGRGQIRPNDDKIFKLSFE